MFVFIFHNTYILAAVLRLEMRLRESIVKLIMISNQEHQDGGGAEGFRNRGDLCMVYALEWALRAVLKDDSFQIPDEFWQARADHVDKMRETNQPFDPNAEGQYLLSLFKDLQAKDERLKDLELRVIIISDIIELLNLVNKGANVIVMSAGEGVPHMYHLGKYDADSGMFISGQQTTFYNDLAAELIQKGELRIAVIKPKGESLGLIFEN